MSRPASTGSRRSSHEDSTLIRRLVYVALFLEVGLLLIVLPWSTFWERNYFAYAWPALRPVLTNHFLRGGISGLGLVTLCAGFAELVPVFAVREAHDRSISDGADTQVGP
jgi:polyferredoxin